MMTERERWIVYPILFFSVLLGVKTKWDAATGTTKLHEVRCKQLVVESEFGDKLIVLGEAEAGGGAFEMNDEQGSVSARLLASSEGGQVVLMRSSDGAAIAFSPSNDSENGWSVVKLPAKSPPGENDSDHDAGDSDETPPATDAPQPDDVPQPNGETPPSDEAQAADQNAETP